MLFLFKSADNKQFYKIIKNLLSSQYNPKIIQV